MKLRHLMKRPIPLPLVPACLLLLLLALNFPLRAAAVPAKETWTSVRSKNFFLIGNASEKEIRQVGTRLEQFRFVFSQLFPKANLASPIPTTVVVFKNDGAYKPYKPLHGGKPKDVAGYFQPGPDVNYITLTTEKRDGSPYAIIFHEFVHLLLENNMKDPPVWFNEGLAEYYSTFEISDGDKKVTLGKPITDHVLLLRERFMPLDDLLRVRHDSPAYNEREKKGVFYAETWALVHYLLQSNNGQRVAQLARFSSLLDAGRPLEESFQQVFQTDFKTMENELRKYVRNSSYRINIFETEKPLVFDAEMQVATLTEAETQSYLGDLLLHINRLDDAERHLQQAITLAPDLGHAYASLGMLRVRQDRFADAKQYLQKAVAANARNHLAHYYYALALNREVAPPGVLVRSMPPETAQLIRAELKKAIELNPRFTDSYDLLAFVSLVTGEYLDEAEQLLKQAQKLTPNRQEFAIRLVEVYLRRQNFEAARQTLETVLRGSNVEPQQRARAEAMLNQLKSFAEQRAQFEELRKGAEAAAARQQPEMLTETSTTEGEASNSPSPPAKIMIPRRAGGEQARGLLTNIECLKDGSAVFHVKLDGRVLRLRAGGLERIEFVTYVQNISGEIGCGVRRPENPVIVTFRPQSAPKAKFDGDLVVVEFITPEMELEPR